MLFGCNFEKNIQFLIKLFAYFQNWIYNLDWNSSFVSIHHSKINSSVSQIICRAKKKISAIVSSACFFSSSLTLMNSFACHYPGVCETKCGIIYSVTGKREVKVICLPWEGIEFEMQIVEIITTWENECAAHQQFSSLCIANGIIQNK